MEPCSRQANTSQHPLPWNNPPGLQMAELAPGNRGSLEVEEARTADTCLHLQEQCSSYSRAIRDQQQHAPTAQDCQHQNRLNSAGKSTARVPKGGRESLAIYPSQSSWFPVKQTRWIPEPVSGSLRSDMEMILRYLHGPARTGYLRPHHSP